PGVRLIGPVPDVRPYVLAADFSIAPLQIARGIQNKVLESLSCGRPVIATEHAATGIAKMPGLLVAESPENWTTQVHKLMDSTELERLGSQSRQRVIQNYSWDAQLAGLLPLLGLNK
ncbi:MAG: glycosyltransferase, partial [Pirellula sp.]